MDVSIVIPLHNEQTNVQPLYEELTTVMEASRLTYEVIFVDDGSRDDTVKHLRAVADADPRCTIVELTRNFGQSAAMDAGFRLANGRYVVPMDGDMQNDPRDIPRLVAKLESAPNMDVVSGWRRDRKDTLFSRRLPSVLANRLIARVTYVRIHDFGCSMKAYRREVLRDVQLYGEMHRFLPAILQWRGARISEEVVNHRPRERGISKYGLKRTVKVLFDLITVQFLGGYLAKPLYFFGKIALLGFSSAFLFVGIAVGQKFGLFGSEAVVNLNRNVLVPLSVMLFLTSSMCIMIGVVSELLVRIYHECRGEIPYHIRSVQRCGSQNVRVRDEEPSLAP